jgi:uncharacterized glyoxalase superfamily protein PhnB
MAKNSLAEQLDRAIEAMIAQPGGSFPSVDSKVEPLLRLAADLRELPGEGFKARLSSDLERRATMATAGVKPIREGFRTITPYLLVEGAAKWIDFVKQAFGAEEILRVARPDGGILHAEVKIGDSMVEMADASGQFPATRTAIHLYVPDADSVYRSALQAGATSLYDPVDQEYGDREGGVKDLFGNNWYIGTHRGRTHVPEGLRGVTACLHPRGAGKLIDFLKQAFGAEEAARYESPEGAIVHAKVRIGDSILEIGEAHGQFRPTTSLIHLYVPDADAVYKRALQAGASPVFAPRDEPYGDRASCVSDSFGNMWCIATHIKDVAV